MSDTRAVPEFENTIITINQTITKWENIDVSDVGGSCPLCNYIRSRTKERWKKGTKNGTCEVCPVYFAGMLYVCISINTLLPINSSIREIEFKNIQVLTLQKLKVLKTFYTKNKTNWNDYIEYVEMKKSFKGKVTKKLPELIQSTRKIIRRKPDVLNKFTVLDSF